MESTVLARHEVDTAARCGRDGEQLTPATARDSGECTVPLSPQKQQVVPPGKSFTFACKQKIESGNYFSIF